MNKIIDARPDGLTVDIRQQCSSPGIAEKLFAGGDVSALNRIEQHLRFKDNRIEDFRQVNDGQVSEKVGA